MLTLPEIFEKDIQGSTTNIHPVVIIRTDPEIYLSQIEEVIEYNGVKTNFKALNLKVPSIKESVDLETRNMKVNNITLTVSNKDSFSDLFSARNFLNVFVDIYYKSQSSTSIDDCLHIYRASIKRVNHDYNNVKIILEDLTESVMHKEVPITRLSSINAVRDSDINKIIPMTFGDVQKAPCILYKDLDLDTDRQKRIYCLPDRFDMPIKPGITNSRDALEPYFDWALTEDNYEIYAQAGYMINHSSEGGISTGLLYIHSGSYLKCMEEPYMHEKVDEGVIDEDRRQLYTETWVSDNGGFGSRTYLSAMYSGFVPTNHISMEIMQVMLHRPANHLSISPRPSYYQPTWAGYNDNWLGEDTGVFIHNKHLAFDNSYDSYATCPDSALTTLEDVPDSDDVNFNVDFSMCSDSLSSDYNTSGSYLNAILDRESTSNDWSTVWDETDSNITLGSENVAYWQIHRYIMRNLGSISEECDIEFIYIPTAKKLFDMYKNWYSSPIDITAQSIAGYSINGINRDLNNIRSWSDNTESPGVSSNGNLYWDNIFKHQWGTPLDFQLHDDVYSESGGYLANQINGYEVIGDSLASSYQHLDQLASTGSMTTPGYLFQIAMNVEPWHLVDLDPTGELGHPDPPSRAQFICFGLDYEGNQISGYNSDGVSNITSAGGINTGDGSMEANIEFWDLLAFNGFQYEDLPRFKIENVSRETLESIYDFGNPGNSSNDKKVLVYKDIFYTLWNGTHRGDLQNNFETATYGTWFGVKSDGDGSLFHHNQDDWNKYFSKSGWHVHFLEDWDMHGDSGLKVPKGSMFPLAVPMPEAHPYEDYTYDLGMENPYAKLVGKQSDIEYSVPLTYNENFLTMTSEEDWYDVNDRIAFLFTLPDSNVDDAIDDSGLTYFHGKIQILNDQNTTSDNNDYFGLYLGFADVEEASETEGMFVGALSTVSLFQLNDHEGALTLYDSMRSVIGSGSYDDAEHGSAHEIVPKQRHEISYDWDIPSRFNAATLEFIFEPGNTVAASFRFNHLAMKHVFEIENIFNKNFYIESLGRNTSNMHESSPPTSVIRNIIEEELEIPIQLHESYWITEDIISDWSMAFSVTEKMNSKKLIEDIAKNSPIIPLFRSDAKLGMSIIKNEYAESDVDNVIFPKDIIDISFDRTKVEKVKTMVRVKHSKDYEDDSYDITSYVDAYDFYGNGDTDVTNFPNGYKKRSFALDPNNPGDSVLEFESNYTRYPSNYIFGDYFDATTLYKLRDFILAYNCNQHNIIKVTLPLKYVSLEITDIIRFDSLINDLKCFGEDYTILNTRNGQEIYPYFMVTKITKGTKNIKIECLQMHNLNRNSNVLSSASGDFDRNGIVDSSDHDSIFNHISYPKEYITEGQTYNCDMNGDKTIDAYDLSILSETLDYYPLDFLSMYMETRVTKPSEMPPKSISIRENGEIWVNFPDTDIWKITFYTPMMLINGGTNPPWVSELLLDVELGNIPETLLSTTTIAQHKITIQNYGNPETGDAVAGHPMVGVVGIVNTALPLTEYWTASNPPFNGSVFRMPLFPTYHINDQGLPGSEHFPHFSNELHSDYNLFYGNKLMTEFNSTDDWDGIE